jgi:hypothetical protein
MATMDFPPGLGRHPGGRPAPAERLLLEGMRLWAAAAGRAMPPLPAPRPPFITEGAGVPSRRWMR